MHFTHGAAVASMGAWQKTIRGCGDGFGVAGPYGTAPSSSSSTRRGPYRSISHEGKLGCGC